MSSHWETVIGVEVHAQLKTSSKLFSSSPLSFGSDANSSIDNYDLALPGTLPVLNERAVELAVRFGVATDAKVNLISAFDRKNYFYPDLPKGYQISQFYRPIIGRGALDIELPDGTSKRIGITRAHLEEDAGKSMHDEFIDVSGIDFNRVGTPLLEIVSEPDLRSAEETNAYLRQLHRLLQFTGVSDGKMAEGSFRVDVNISVREKGASQFGTRVELKNLNSFRFIERAIAVESQRHIDLLESGRRILQQTREFDPDKETTRALRAKTDADDYRYFPDPDLPPVLVDAAIILKVKREMPELPSQRLARYVSESGIHPDMAASLCASRECAEYFDVTVEICKNAKAAANWVTGEIAAARNRDRWPAWNTLPVSPQHLGTLINRVSEGVLSSTLAKQAFDDMWKTGDAPDAVIERRGLKQISGDDALTQLVTDIVSEFPEQVAQYRSGKTKVFGFFVGQAMQRTRGQADAAKFSELLKAALL